MINIILFENIMISAVYITKLFQQDENLKAGLYSIKINCFETEY